MTELIRQAGFGTGRAMAGQTKGGFGGGKFSRHLVRRVHRGPRNQGSGNSTSMVHRA